MCMLLMQRIGDTVQVFDEIVLPNANTEAACQAFHERIEPLYKPVPTYLWPMRIFVYGDASGHQKRTSAADTNWTIIRQFFARWKGRYQESFHVLTANPPVRDRINCVNSRLAQQS